MRGRPLGMMIAAALVGMAASAAAGAKHTFADAAKALAGGNQIGPGETTNGAQPPRYPGYGKRMGVKQAQRSAAKHRNVLRSKGHFRKAVR